MSSCFKMNYAILFGSLGFILIILICCCACCCKRKRNQQKSIKSPVIVTSTTHTQGPYPVSVQGGVPQMQGVAYPMPHHQQGFAPSPYQMQQQGGYPPMPQPAGFPMPQPGGFQQQYQAPYPPANQSAATMNPPSYDQAVQGEAYQKQAPFNPNYSQ